MVIITEKTLKKLVKEFLITIGFLSIATVIGMLLIYIGFTESNVTMVYLLCVLLISIFTNGYIWSVAGSLVSVVLMNFFLTEPRFTFHAYDTGYPLTCVIMLAASMLTGTLASKLKKHVRMSEQAAYREKTLQLRANLLRTISEHHSHQYQVMPIILCTIMISLIMIRESRYLQIYMMIQNG